MKIAYVAELNLDIHKGVLQKIYQQTLCWKKYGHNVKIYIKGYTIKDVKSYENFIFYASILNVSPLKTKLIKKFFDKCLTHRKMVRDIKDFEPNLIYLRYRKWFPFLVKSLRSIASYVVELNTDDVNEIRLSGSIRYYYNKITRKFLLRRAAGLVCISDEIARRNSNFHKPICAIGNGYDLSSVKPLPAPCNKRPQVLFVGGGYVLWHGIDKIISLAKYIREFDFHIIGLSKSDYPLRADFPENIYFHGYLSKARLINIYNMTDVGVGSLALHRNQMNEGSPLKVREYLAYGIPTIIGYKDIDLKAENPAILQLPNRENNVIENIDRIRKFVINQVGKRVNPDSISMLSYRRKENIRLLFLGKLA